MGRSEAVQRALGVEQPTLIAANHFLQEDRSVELAAAVARLAGV